MGSSGRCRTCVGVRPREGGPMTEPTAEESAEEPAAEMPAEEPTAEVSAEEPAAEQSAEVPAAEVPAAEVPAAEVPPAAQKNRIEVIGTGIAASAALKSLPKSRSWK